jgi:hypothetical protein
MPSIRNVKLLAGVHLRMEGKRFGIYQLIIFVGFKGARFYKQHSTAVQQLIWCGGLLSFGARCCFIFLFYVSLRGRKPRGPHAKQIRVIYTRKRTGNRVCNLLTDELLMPIHQGVIMCMRKGISLFFLA